MALTASCARLWRFRVLDSPLYPLPALRPFARSSLTVQLVQIYYSVMNPYRNVPMRLRLEWLSLRLATSPRKKLFDCLDVICTAHPSRYVITFGTLWCLELKLDYVDWTTYCFCFTMNCTYVCNTVSGLVSYFINYRVLTTISWKSCE